MCRRANPRPHPSVARHRSVTEDIRWAIPATSRGEVVSPSPVTTAEKQLRLPGSGLRRQLMVGSRSEDGLRKCSYTHTHPRTDARTRKYLFFGYIFNGSFVAFTFA